MSLKGINAVLIKLFFVSKTVAKCSNRLDFHQDVAEIGFACCDA